MARDDPGYCEWVNDLDARWPEEQAQLCEMFGMSNAELDGVLSACAYFFEHAAYTTMRPRALKEALLQAGMDDAHAELAQQVWAVEATDYVTKLRDRTNMVRAQHL